MFFKRGVRKGAQLRREASSECWSVRRWAPRGASGGKIPCRTALLELALDGGQGDLEGTDDIDACHPAVDCCEHAQAEIFGIARHTGRVHHGSLLKQAALEQKFLLSKLPEGVLHIIRHQSAIGECCAAES